MNTAARDRLHIGGTSFDPERLTRYERGLNLNSSERTDKAKARERCAVVAETPNPRGLASTTIARLQAGMGSVWSSLTRTLSDLCGIVAIAAAEIISALIVAGCIVIPVVFLIWLAFQIARPLV